MKTTLPIFGECIARKVTGSIFHRYEPEFVFGAAMDPYPDNFTVLKIRKYPNLILVTYCIQGEGITQYVVYKRSIWLTQLLQTVTAKLTSWI